MTDRMSFNIFYNSGSLSTPRSTISLGSKIFTLEVFLYSSMMVSVRYPVIYLYERFFLISWLAGQDATEAFYGLHKHEIIVKPQYARLQIGVIEGEKSVIHGRVHGELSKVPYAEPTWLTAGYFSPYFSEVCSSFD